MITHYASAAAAAVTVKEKINRPTRSACVTAIDFMNLFVIRCSAVSCC